MASCANSRKIKRCDNKHGMLLGSNHPSNPMSEKSKVKSFCSKSIFKKVLEILRWC